MRKGWVKGICALLGMICLFAGIVGGWFALAYEANMPSPENFYESAFCWNVTEEKRDMVKQIAKWSLDEELSNYNQQRLIELRQQLSSRKTNFRYVCYTPDATVLCGNVTGESWKKEIYQVHTLEITEEAWYYDEQHDVYVQEAIPTITPTTHNEPTIVGAMDSITGITYYDEPASSLKYTMEYGVLAPLSVEDEYAAAQAQMEWLEQWFPVIAGVSIALIVVGLILLIALFCGAGRRVGREDVVLNWHDKIPYDLYLALGACAVILLLISAVEGAYYLEWPPEEMVLLWVGASILGLIIVAMAFLLTTATRIKARTIFRNTISWRLCAWLWRLVKKLCGAVNRCASALNRAIHTLPMVWRIVVLFLVYLLGALLTAVLLIVGIIWFDYDGWAVLLTLLMIVGIPAWHGFALYLICRWALQWRRIREATQSVVAGKTEVQIDTEKFYPDLEEHAQQLNGLGLAIDNAVGERMKSERFKAELITNVSHDLKTPLTSIINYVDLLKKEEISNPTAQEYIEVLDRKSQRLKKLTEDLVEASKASTGALVVNKERLDVIQLIRQALGEYEEKLTNAGLTLVTTLPEQELYINGDGRHVWRVLDNLLSNCAKYALEGTRVYLDAAVQEGSAVITVKNISRQELNVPPEQLVERFVRGDESRTTEGSGLGLSIARSLVDLQGGRFDLNIDGDLFKAKVVLPLAGN